MEKYSSYKDSGVQWLGQIPSHWEVKHLRNFLTLFSEKGYGDAQLLSVTREKGVILRDRDDKEENHNYVPDDLSGYKHLMPGDFVINKMKSWQGSYGVSEYEGIVSPAYFTCKLKGVDPQFFSQAIRSKAYIGFFMQYSKGIRVDQWDLDPSSMKDIPFILPPLDEQKRIVPYLDAATAKIDEAIAQQQRMIDLLNERKQIEIVRATTKGIRTNRVMKDSGNNWIGFIPEDWNIVSLKRRSSIILGKMLTRGDAEKGDFYICAKDVHFDGVEITDLKKMFFSHEEKLRYRVKEGDLLIVEGGAGAGGCAVVKELLFDIFIQNSIMIIRGNDELDNNYVAYFLQGIVNNSYIDYVCNKATIPHFTKEKVGATIIPLPSVSEQKNIIRFKFRK